MHHPAPQISPAQAALGQTSTLSHAAESHAGSVSVEPLLRVGRFLQAVAAARALSDQEIRQHAADCAALMELAYARFEAHGNPADREEAVLWMSRRDEAHRSLSPAWKAARETQIREAIAAGLGCYFTEQGDAARARAGRGRG
jgi:hypothetical protein